ncbi:hypothetical protein C8J56DRAFT_379927 [Mycena floridula]|nr:hypothetical protein C8J56DRAFT_473061 [Mycena floridula]KAJ7577100.1 hypothetical protein C8J56DRAFT_379927 [Mycena floridula]
MAPRRRNLKLRTYIQKLLFAIQEISGPWHEEDLIKQIRRVLKKFGIPISREKLFNRGIRTALRTMVLHNWVQYHKLTPECLRLTPRGRDVLRGLHSQISAEEADQPGQFVQILKKDQPLEEFIKLREYDDDEEMEADDDIDQTQPAPEDVNMEETQPEAGPSTMSTPPRRTASFIEYPTPDSNYRPMVHVLPAPDTPSGPRRITRDRSMQTLRPQVDPAQLAKREAARHQFAYHQKKELELFEASLRAR